jgi:hypothetical protein
VSRTRFLGYIKGAAIYSHLHCLQRRGDLEDQAESAAVVRNLRLSSLAQ